MATRTELEESVGFVLYHLWMLRECAKMPMPANRVLRNLWYEGLASHSRVLRDFFFTKLDKHGARCTKPDDVVAVDYFTAPASWPYTSHALPPYLDQIKARMDRALAHLSTARIGYEKQNKDWDANLLLAEIYDKWFGCMAKLDSECSPSATWFRHHRRARLVPFTPPA
jgi:hypothetical protein